VATLQQLETLILLLVTSHKTSPVLTVMKQNGLAHPVTLLAAGNSTELIMAQNFT
jgi:hypothetical protein